MKIRVIHEVEIPAEENLLRDWGQEKYIAFIKHELANSLAETLSKKILPERIINPETKRLTYELHGYIILGEQADKFGKALQSLINSIS